MTLGCMTPRLQNAITRFDWILLLTALALTAVGLIVIYGLGISRAELGLFPFQKQVVALCIGIAFVIGFIFFDYRQLRSLAIPIFLFGALLLIGVLFFGDTVRGTRGWYSIGSISFQPVEIAKVCLILFLSSYLSKYVHKAIPFYALCGSFVATAIYVGLVLLQPDFGSAMVILSIWGLLVLFVGLPWKTILLLLLSGLVVVGFAWFFAFEDFQKDRIAAFLHPEADASGAGYNVTQAAIAIGSGGLLGKGIGEGSQSRLRFLPEAATDFTFSVIGEELGFLGIAFVFVVFGMLFYRLFLTMSCAEDDFASIAIFGIGALLLIHLTINAGMNMGVMPVTGIPLPFISGASSFLIAVFIAVGFAESVAVHRRVS